MQLPEAVATLEPSVADVAVDDVDAAVAVDDVVHVGVGSVVGEVDG